MKIRRYKKVSKNIGFYINNFGFRQPYQLLVDGTFCFAALNNKINIANDVAKYLQDDIKLITTQCAIIEMEKLGPKLNGALIILKKYVVHKCGHEGKPVVGSRCLFSMVENENPSHYFICTQDRELQEKLRNLPGVPLLYLHMKTPVLEQPSKSSVERGQEKIASLRKNEMEKVQKLKEINGIVDDKPKPKRKKKGGPNPLSCKKKQKPKGVEKEEGNPEKDKKRRKRVRLPHHVIEELFKNKISKLHAVDK